MNAGPGAGAGDDGSGRSGQAPAGTVRVAGIDCGTNSVRLLIADVGADGTVRDVVRRMRIVRLGEGVDRTGRLNPAALERTFTALCGYAELIEAAGARHARMCATSATRDAVNRDEFVRGVRNILGVEPEVVTGDEEAALSFAGATAGVSGLEPPLLVVDIGGGSTEFVLGPALGDEGVLAAGSSGKEQPALTALSVDIGCVRLTERHLASDPPAPEQVAAAVRDIDAGIALAAGRVPLIRAVTVVGLAGTVTTLAALALQLPGYDPDAIHLSRLAAADIERLTSQLLSAPAAERAALPVMHPGRVDVIGAGALILRQIVRHTGASEVVVSEHDILDGIALSAARRARTAGGAAPPAMGSDFNPHRSTDG